MHNHIILVNTETKEVENVKTQSVYNNKIFNLDTSTFVVIQNTLSIKRQASKQAKNRQTSRQTSEETDKTKLDGSKKAKKNLD